MTFRSSGVIIARGWQEQFRSLTNVATPLTGEEIAKVNEAFFGVQEVITDKLFDVANILDGDEALNELDPGCLFRLKSRVYDALAEAADAKAS